LPAGGLSPDQHQMDRLFPPLPGAILVLSRVFRSKFVSGLKADFHRGELQFCGTLQSVAEAYVFLAPKPIEMKRSLTRRLGARNEFVIARNNPRAGLLVG
jgi:hypothetical protein